MSTFKSPDGRTSIELTKTDYLAKNGSQTFSFTCKVKSHGFLAEVENLWFYKEDLLGFADKLTHLLTGSTNHVVELSAMSDFTCSVEPTDSFGHFTLKTTLESAVQ